MLRYINHPFFDVGIATLAAFVGKRNPQDLTHEDLSTVADYIRREYVRPPLRGFLHGAVFPNSGFTQPAYFDKPDEQQKYANAVLQGYMIEQSTNEQCVFTGKPAVALSFDVKDALPLGRAFRQHIPLLTGENVINFHPYGDAGLPVSGEAMLAIQALPLGCAKSEGRLLMVHSDNPEITYHFANTFLEHNRKVIQLATGSDKVTEPHLKHRTLLISTLLQAEIQQHDALDSEQTFSVSAYHLSNSGQDPKLNIYHLPMQVIKFVREMKKAKHSRKWNAIVNRAWDLDASKDTGRRNNKEPFQPARNWLYEDLFDLDLPQNASRFIRTYFLRTGVKHARSKLDPRQKYSLISESDLVSWEITVQFLGRIMNMNQQQIEQIRQMGDQLAVYIKEENDKLFFGNFRCKNYHEFRTNLLKVNLNQVKRGRAPIVRFDPYIEVFELAEGDARIDWRLARDLVFIRLLEQLHDMNWLEREIVEQVADNVDEDSVDI